MVGAGFIAGRHVDNFLRYDGVVVAGVADVDHDRASALAARCRAHTYRTADELLDAEPLDALYICVPPFAHGPPERAALELGVPFFVEKPLAVDYATAESVAAAVADRRLVTATGYHWRYLDIVERAAAILADRPPRLALGYWLDTTPPPAWWSRPSESGGQLVEQTTHIFDLARQLVGEIVTLRADGCRVTRPGRPDADVFAATTATMRFASGALGTVASTCLLRGAHRVGLHLYGEGFAVELSERELLVHDEGGARCYEAAEDPFDREDRDFLDAVRGANRVRTPYPDALASHRVATAAASAALDGSTVVLGPAGDHG